MVECEVCGTDVSGGSAFTCTYCAGTFCPAHRLPFNHACRNIEDWRRSKPKKRESVVSQRKPGVIENKGLIAAGVIILFLIIMVFWFFRAV